jgi:hypothetical protein
MGHYYSEMMCDGCGKIHCNCHYESSNNDKTTPAPGIDHQQLMINNLSNTLDLLKRCEPYLDADDIERSCLARHFIRRIILGMVRSEGVVKPSLADRLRDKGYQPVPDATLQAMLGDLARSVSLNHDE